MTPQMSCYFRSAQEEAHGCSTPPGKAKRCVFQPGVNEVLVWCSDDGFQLQVLLYLQNFLVLFQVSGDFFSVAIKLSDLLPFTTLHSSTDSFVSP